MRNIFPGIVTTINEAIKSFDLVALVVTLGEFMFGYVNYKYAFQILLGRQKEVNNGEGHTKSQIGAISGPRKWTLVQQKILK